LLTQFGLAIHIEIFVSIVGLALSYKNFELDMDREIW